MTSHATNREPFRLPLRFKLALGAADEHLRRCLELENPALVADRTPDDALNGGAFFQHRVPCGGDAFWCRMIQVDRHRPLPSQAASGARSSHWHPGAITQSSVSASA